MFRTNESTWPSQTDLIFFQKLYQLWSFNLKIQTFSNFWFKFVIVYRRERKVITRCKLFSPCPSFHETFLMILCNMCFINGFEELCIEHTCIYFRTFLYKKSAFNVLGCNCFYLFHVNVFGEGWGQTCIYFIYID